MAFLMLLSTMQQKKKKNVEGEFKDGSCRTKNTNAIMQRIKAKKKKKDEVHHNYAIFKLNYPLAF